MKKTPISKIKELSLIDFDTNRQFQSYVRKEGKCPDNMSIAGILYTMDEYDNDGEYITYYNQRTDRQIRVDTTNRYKSTKDAIVRLFRNFGMWRNDIVYLD